MARSAAARGKRPKPDAGRGDRRPGRSTRIEEETLFFPRLRRQAKWVFLLLAIVFAGGFVFFGVGSGNSGLSDVFDSIFKGGSSGDSIGGLEKRVAKNPGDADAYLKLSRALRNKGREDEAIAPLERYTDLRPKDSSALQELAGLYLVRARTYYDQLALINYELAGAPGSGFALPPNSFLAKELQNDPFYKNVVAELSKRQAEVGAKFNAALSSRADAYKRAVAALPADDTSLPGTVFAWARAAEDAQDYTTALTAYRRYLKLAPESGLATDARKAITRLKAYIATQQPG